MTPTVRTERLVLRPWRPEDRGPFAALNADPVVMEHFRSTMTLEETDDFIARIETCWAERGWGLWAVEVEAGAPFIGYVGLWPAEHVTDDPCEVGWRLAREHWGHGYAPEAAREALRFGFEDVGLDHIVSFTVPQNERSWKVMEKIGLRRVEGADFDHPSVDPATHPHLVRHVYYRLDAGGWASSRS